MMSFKGILNDIDTIALEPKRTIKEKLIEEMILKHGKETIQKIVLAAYNPFIKYNVSDVQFIDEPNIFSNIESTFVFLNFLSKSRGCTNEDRYKLNRLASVDMETATIFDRIVKKDLRCGVSIKTWRLFFPELITHDVMLCDNNLEKFIELAKTYDNVILNKKLDGVRTWGVVDLVNQTVKYLSRNGKEYVNFNIFDEELIKLAKECCNDSTYIMNNQIIFDGEVVSVDEDFQQQMSQVHRLENADSSIFRFSIFDIVDAKHVLRDRYDILQKYLDPSYTYINLVEFKTITEDQFNATALIDICNEYCDKGMEGIVLKTWNGIYEFDRSSEWCKVKRFYTVDLKVIGIKLGNGKYKKVVGKLVCKYEDNMEVVSGKNKLSRDIEILVGSGLSDAQRKEFLTNPPTMIEVKYQEVTKDGSLRFPVFIRVREDK